MAKYLQQIATEFGSNIGRVVTAADAIHLGPMYERYATPVLSNGIAKLHIKFSETESSSDPDAWAVEPHGFEGCGW